MNGRTSRLIRRVASRRKAKPKYLKKMWRETPWAERAKLRESFEKWIGS